MTPQTPRIAIGGQLPPIRWITPKPTIYTHKTYAELRSEGIVTPYYHFANWVDLGDLSVVYCIGGVRERVKLTHIIPTQSSVLKRVVAYYMAKKRLTGEGGLLPFGVRFADSPAVYLTDGHHRFEAARRLGRTHLRMRVETHPISLAEALKG
ncbi:MAG: hypothetical protein KJ043_18975 [Anaerolineae bacterium]|nr:hypothetical protein [Anaerolineae bacterium]